MPNIRITHHARERYLERTRNKYKYLKKRISDQLSTSLIFELNNELKKNKKEIDNEIYQKIEESKENKSFLNDSNFMEGYYKRYGFENRIHFLVNTELNLVFVCLEESNSWIMVTVRCCGKDRISRSAKQPKYKKRT